LARKAKHGITILNSLKHLWCSTGDVPKGTPDRILTGNESGRSGANPAVVHFARRRRLLLDTVVVV